MILIITDVLSDAAAYMYKVLSVVKNKWFSDLNL